MTERPATASDLAESPSVRMSVHCSARAAEPAQLASSSLGRSSRRACAFLPPPARCSSDVALKRAHESTRSTTPEASTAFMNFSESSASEPKSFGRVVSVSLVWLSKAGFSMSALTKTVRWLRTCCGFTSTAPLFFLLACSAMAAATWSTTWFTCWPPFVVAMALTKDTWPKAPSESERHTSQRALTRSQMRGAASSVT